MPPHTCETCEQLNINSRCALEPHARAKPCVGLFIIVHIWVRPWRHARMFRPVCPMWAFEIMLGSMISLAAEVRVEFVTHTRSRAGERCGELYRSPSACTLTHYIVVSWSRARLLLLNISTPTHSDVVHLTAAVRRSGKHAWTCVCGRYGHLCCTRACAERVREAFSGEHTNERYATQCWAVFRE